MNTKQVPEAPAPPRDVTILKHCRCIDCRHFHRVGGRYVCDRNVGGTGVVWATGEHVCNPPKRAWHYCKYYHGPQISKNVYIWNKKWFLAGKTEGDVDGNSRQYGQSLFGV